jgi:hypothetical protein
MSGWLGPLIQGATSLFGAYTANQAGRQQQQAAQQAMAQQQGATDQQLNLLTQIYNQNRADNAPFRQAGTQAVGQYAAQVAQPFQQTPGYQFTQDEAMRGVMANASARGLVNSGSVLRALQDRSANIADQTYGNYMNRLAALSGIGQTATGQGMAAGQGFGGQASGVIGQGTQAANNFMTQGAGAAAGGQINAANALMGGANNLLSYWSQGR